MPISVVFLPVALIVLDSDQHGGAECALGEQQTCASMSSLWKMLRVLDDRRFLPGAGRLFREA